LQRNLLLNECPNSGSALTINCEIFGIEIANWTHISLHDTGAEKIMMAWK